MFVCGLGDLNSNLVAYGFCRSLIVPSNTVLFLEGASTLFPSEVTIHTGASNPGFNLLKESFVDEVFQNTHY